ncbi:MAG: hypothetical protein AAFW84_24780 [Cyanobacteria bacterium J06635_15]
MATTSSFSDSSPIDPTFLSVLFPDDIAATEPDPLTGMEIVSASDAQAENSGGTTQSSGPLADPLEQSDQQGNEDVLTPAVAEEQLKVATLDVSEFQAPDGVLEGNDTAVIADAGADDTTEAPGTEENKAVIADPAPENQVSTSLDSSQQAVVDAIVASGADILGLTGLINDGYSETSTLQALVNALNTQLGEEVYTAIVLERPHLGYQETTVGILYKPAVVSPLGKTAVLETGAFAQEEIEAPDGVSNSSPQENDGTATTVETPLQSDTQVPLAQAFEEIATGEVFTTVITDLSAQGVDDTTDIQVAQELADWLATNPTEVFDSDVLILGDFNENPQAEPTLTLQSAGYTPLISASEPGEFDPSRPDPEAPVSSSSALSNAALTGQVSSVNGQPFELDPTDPGIEEPEIGVSGSEPPATGEPSVSNQSELSSEAIEDDTSDPVAPSQTAFIVGLTLERTKIEGTQQRDSLVGTAADEIFVGLAGGDLITTGDGYDTLVYTSMRDGGDRISDFSPLHDRIALTQLFQASDISASTFTDAISLGYLSVQERGDETWLRFDASGSGTGRTLVILEGVSAGDLSDSNFT